jgi:hypothetical protein
LGFGGRDRRAASEAERARVSVTKALKSAIRRIAAQDAELGEHPAHSVKTGSFVAYDPNPTVSISWGRLTSGRGRRFRSGRPGRIETGRDHHAGR